MRRIDCFTVTNDMVGGFLDFTIYWAIEKLLVSELVSFIGTIIDVWGRRHHLDRFR